MFFFMDKLTSKKKHQLNRKVKTKGSKLVCNSKVSLRGNLNPRHDKHNWEKFKPLPERRPTAVECSMRW